MVLQETLKEWLTQLLQANFSSFSKFFTENTMGTAALNGIVSIFIELDVRTFDELGFM
jgi:hypothetical protein